MKRDVTSKIEEVIPPVGGQTGVGEGNGFERRLGRIASHHPMVALKVAHAADRTLIQRIADLLIRLASSPAFLVVHLLWFSFWILWNTGELGLRPFDPYPFGFLTLVVSLEAIFLSIFVLMGQSREAAIAELREELTLQVNLRMEAEVTKTLQLVAGLYTRLGYQTAQDEELKNMLQALDAAGLERELMEQIRKSQRG